MFLDLEIIFGKWRHFVWASHRGYLRIEMDVGLSLKVDAVVMVKVKSDSVLYALNDTTWTVVLSYPVLSVLRLTTRRKRERSVRLAFSFFIICFHPTRILCCVFVMFFVNQCAFHVTIVF